ncbi:MAG: malonic semialdehyde reductase [Oligoflexia bacterium]|nr:malonic semialdehyde reductase [Oligoflexia bacterium]
MTKPISTEALDQIFLKARSHHAWQNKPVDDDLLKKIYDLTKYGPTSLNTSPARIVFVKSQEEKARLLPALMGSNVEQAKAAPVTAIIGHDLEFYEKLKKLAPPVENARSWFAGNQAMIDSTAFRNSSLQGAYFIIAARALGLDVCPMSGFDNAKIDETFFKGASVKSNFICTLGYGDTSKLHERWPRLDFVEACKIV